MRESWFGGIRFPYCEHSFAVRMLRGWKRPRLGSRLNEIYLGQNHFHPGSLSGCPGLPTRSTGISKNTRVLSAAIHWHISIAYYRLRLLKNRGGSGKNVRLTPSVPYVSCGSDMAGRDRPRLKLPRIIIAANWNLSQKALVVFCVEFPPKKTRFRAAWAQIAGRWVMSPTPRRVRALCAFCFIAHSVRILPVSRLGAFTHTKPV